MTSLRTNYTWRDCLEDIRETMRKWGMEDYLLPTLDDSRRTRKVAFKFAVTGRWSELECSIGPNRHAPFDPITSLRAIGLALDSARKADQRGIGALLAEATRHLALHSGTADPYQVLRANPSMSREELQRAYRRRLMETHPDTGGSREAFDQVRGAAEELELIESTQR